MPAFYILAAIVVVGLFFLISFLYKPIGGYISKVFDDAKENAVGEDNKIKIIRHSKMNKKGRPKSIIMECTNSICKCKFRYKLSSDEKILVDDWNDPYLKITCPECGYKITKFI